MAVLLRRVHLGCFRRAFTGRLPLAVGILLTVGAPAAWGPVPARSAPGQVPADSVRGREDSASREPELAPAARESLAVADSLTGPMIQRLRAGDYPRAEAMARRQLALRQGALGTGSSLEIATSLTYLVLALRNAGKLDEAERYARDAVAMMLDLHGRRHADTATALANLAGVLKQRGDLLGAEALTREALFLQRSLLGEDDPALAVLYNNLGTLLQQQGEWSTAEAMFRRSVAITEASRGATHRNTALALKNLATTLQAQGSLDEAESLLRRVRAIYEASYGTRHLRVAAVYHDLGTLLYERGEWAAADSLLRASLAIRNELVGEPFEKSAETRNRLGTLLAADGHIADALDQHRRALESYQALFGREHPRVVESEVLLAGVHLRAGHLEEARSLLESAAGAYEAARRRGGTGVTRATLRTPSPYPLLAAVRLREGDGPRAWDAAERAQGRVLADMVHTAEQRTLTPAESARQDSLAARLAELEGSLEALRRGSPDDPARTSAADPPELEALYAQLLHAEADWSRFQGAMADAHPVTEGRAYPLGRIQASLEENAALVGWLDAADAVGAVGSWAYVVRRDAPVAWFDLAVRPASPAAGAPPSPPAEAALRTVLAGENASALGLVMTDDVRQLAHAVWNARLQPCAPALEGIETLIVVPSGDMVGVPVEVLIDPDGTAAIERFTISYVPSATIHAWLEERPHETSSSARDRGLFVGDPPFCAAHLAEMESGVAEDASPVDRGTSRRPQMEDLPRLRWTRSEVEASAALFAEPTLLVGPKATEGALATMAARGDLSRYGTIHLATHAVADADRPEESALILAQTGLGDPVQALLAHRPVYDGVVTARDIMSTWHLQADLVTLSACGSGLGRRVANEGYVGFAHAFFQAGSRSLLVSLWEVDDEATALLMQRFYENHRGAYGDARGGGVGEALSKADALREAKRWLMRAEDGAGRRPFEHPHYWAAFVLVGDAR